MIVEEFIIGMAVGMSLWFVPCIYILYCLMKAVRSIGSKVSGSVNAIVPMLGAFAPMLGMALPNLGERFRRPPSPE